MAGSRPSNFPTELGISEIGQNRVCGESFSTNSVFSMDFNTAVRWLSERAENRVAGGNICRLCDATTATHGGTLRAGHDRSRPVRHR